MPTHPWGMILPLLLCGCLAGAARADAAVPLRVGAAAVELAADDAMVIGGGIGPGKAQGQEGKLRAAAVVLQAGGAKLAIVACDVLMVERDVLDDAARTIERQCQIPFAHTLINATHTHHAPTTVTIHGYERDERFTARLRAGIIEAVRLANAQLEQDGAATFAFRLGEESSVGQNSRLLLADGTIYWTGSYTDALRPTGPFDPELPVLAFRRPGGKLAAVLFNHSTHTIGARTPGKRSPGFYGLAAQELEAALGGTFLFLEGASGSTHNLSVKPDEMVRRIRTAVELALAKAQPMPASPLAARKREITVRTRHFDELTEDETVRAYCVKRIGPKPAESVIEVFRTMRRRLAPEQGKLRKTWVQALRIGDVALVGVPGEFFTALGQEIKRQSPFRYTYVAELANDWIGYIPDRKGFELGGYQVWTGLHSYVAPGTGEAIVAEAVSLLNELKVAAPRE